MAVVNSKLNKFEDAERNCSEAEKIQKKIPQSDPEWKKKEEALKKFRDYITQLKKAGESGDAKQIENKRPQSRAANNSNYSLFAYIGGALLVGGVAAFLLMKKRQ